MNWGAPDEHGKARRWRAKHCMDAVRWMISYGVTCGYEDCLRADTILTKLRFPTPPARTTKLLLEHVAAIRPVAHGMGLRSIALATALQFELTLRQKDVIGEWEPAPLAEGGIVYKGRRWVNGLLWSHIDADMVLRKKPTWRKVADAAGIPPNVWNMDARAAAYRRARTPEPTRQTA